MQNYLVINAEDNVAIAINSLAKGTPIADGTSIISLRENIPAKHKFTLHDLKEGQLIKMYGIWVGKAVCDIPKGSKITTANVKHEAADYKLERDNYKWTPPVIDHLKDIQFMGYHRKDGKVGTRNIWLVFPMVFCENRNIKALEQILPTALGYTNKQPTPSVDITKLIDLYQQGASAELIAQTDISTSQKGQKSNRLFPEVDGIKFLTHTMGCGGTREDALAFCKLMAGYIANPNVAGATILSLGCENAQLSLLKKELQQLGVLDNKPLFFIHQQEKGDTDSFLQQAVKSTFLGLMQANNTSRKPSPISQLTLGLECGGSDGFSGITANPVLGYTVDLLIALGAKVMLAEFPELNGVEQQLINRCQSEELAKKFSSLMATYEARAIYHGSGFDKNPSPGNIKDGLITDAMKSAGAAKKGGNSPIVDVLDYTEQAVLPGLNLLCTPGNDVESTTALAGSGANLIAFTTGLGTPTGNPVSPTVKCSSNTSLYQRMPDIIDFNAGVIIDEGASIPTMGEKLLHVLIETASGTYLTKSERLGQDDFIPWKRGVSL